MDGSMFQICLVIIVGITLVISSILKLKKIISLKSNFIRAKGEISIIETTRANDDNLTSIVRFKYLNENNVEFSSEIKDTTYPSLYKVGEQIDVAYDFNDNKSVIVLSKKQKIVYYLWILLGFLMSVYGAGMLVFKIYKK